ncbi:MAG: hypothetical protein ACRD3M_15915 [Thermoanaerobaculia bacterium]
MQVATPALRATLLVDSRLSRRVVDLAADRARVSGDGARAQELSAALEPVYAGFADPADRAVNFESVYRRLFADWGYEQAVATAFAEFPLLRCVESVWLKSAERGESAGADLGGAALRQLGIALPAPLFLEPADLRLFLRRELSAVEDTLDPEFGYSPGALLPDRPGAFENLARDRLRLSWGTSVDGRLARRHPEYSGLREERLAQARVLYRSLPEELPERLIETLWSGPRPAFARLKLWACHNESLLDALLPGARPSSAAFVSGSPCPLCGFPVSRVETVWGSEERQPIAALIAGDFPSWRAEAGACERCVEGYAVRAGQWL